MKHEEVKKEEYKGSSTTIELEEGELPVESKEDPEEGKLVNQAARLDLDSLKDGKIFKDFADQDVHSIATKDPFRSFGCTWLHVVTRAKCEKKFLSRDQQTKLINKHYNGYYFTFTKCKSAKCKETIGP